MPIHELAALGAATCWAFTGLIAAHGGPLPEHPDPVACPVAQTERTAHLQGRGIDRPDRHHSPRHWHDTPALCARRRLGRYRLDIVDNLTCNHSAAAVVEDRRTPSRRRLGRCCSRCRRDGFDFSSVIDSDSVLSLVTISPANAAGARRPAPRRCVCGRSGRNRLDPRIRFRVRCLPPSGR